MIVFNRLHVNLLCNVKSDFLFSGGISGLCYCPCQAADASYFISSSQLMILAARLSAYTTSDLIRSFSMN